MQNEKELQQMNELALRKKVVIESIYDISSRRSFVGEISEIEEFVEYLNMREPYYEELRKIDDEGGADFKNFTLDFNNPNPLYCEISRVVSDIRDMGGKIIEIDKINNEKMKLVHKELMAEVKAINEQKKIQNSYKTFTGKSQYDF